MVHPSGFEQNKATRSNRSEWAPAESQPRQSRLEDSQLETADAQAPAPELQPDRSTAILDALYENMRRHGRDAALILSQIRPLRRRTRLASFIRRLPGNRGLAHPMQGHLSQHNHDAAPAFAGQPLPNRRRQIAHREIQANAPTRTALGTRFSVIRRAPSNYERQCQWDIVPPSVEGSEAAFYLLAPAEIELSP
jgi:hypothetical protein